MTLELYITCSNIGNQKTAEHILTLRCPCLNVDYDKEGNERVSDAAMLSCHAGDYNKWKEMRSRRTRRRMRRGRKRM